MAHHRELLLQGLSDVGSDSALWSDWNLLFSLTACIRPIGTIYPQDMLPSLPLCPPAQ